MPIAETDIELALKAVLEAGNLSWSIAWPNQDHDGVKPYIQCKIVRVNRRDETLDGVMPISRGMVMATTVTERGISSRLGNEKADQIAALFPMGRRIAVTGGEIVILKPADVKEGFPQDADWRTPVQIDYEAS